MADEEVHPASLRNAWKTSRLVYRAIEEDDDDKATMREIMLGDPVAVAMGTYRTISPGSRTSVVFFYELTKHNPLRVFICLPPSPEDGTELEQKDKENEKEKTPKTKPTPIGIITLFWPRGHDFQHHRDVSLGISLVAGQRGKGYGAEAINWALDWGFRWGGYHRIGLTAFSYNTRAIKLYRSLGFVEEGRIRESLYHDRRRYDEIVFGMLASEWERLRGLDKSDGEEEVNLQE